MLSSIDGGNASPVKGEALCGDNADWSLDPVLVKDYSNMA